MSTRSVRVTVELPLDYRTGSDEPERGIFRNSVIPPEHPEELLLAVRSVQSPTSDPYNAKTDGPSQVHLVGTPRALEELGRYLVALARLDTKDPEPYGWVERIRNADGGSARLVLRRAAQSEAGV